MKNKTAAIILALILGGIGMHRFYLGNNGLGFLYLIFSWTFIPLIIAILEAIYLAKMKQKDFDLNYNGDYLRNKLIINNQEKLGNF